ncbi:hypothetical protein KO500_07535 [Cellulophaga baltica]|uniref:hypothetical protein n=1 Tax=Cellulophaga TaxID=104264 RepID=UPI001C07E7D1|nr:MULTISPECIES: hypothetical protein [Cellulophaga]MBU2996281.1 hypothetical protein [Cellulophaga baltica]MDO6767676.1 hypothetical protein [Cellulophaga sp. 1_MG-2023]
MSYKKLITLRITAIVGAVIFILYKFNIMPNLNHNSGNLSKCFSAKVDGDSLSFNKVKAFEIKESKMIIVTAKSSSSDIIELMIPSTLDQGKYNFYDYFSNTNTIITGAYESSNNNGALEGFKSNSKLIITNHDHVLGIITGTFDSKTKSKKITEGEFSVKYK